MHNPLCNCDGSAGNHRYDCPASRCPECNTYGWCSWHQGPKPSLGKWVEEALIVAAVIVLVWVMVQSFR